MVFPCLEKKWCLLPAAFRKTPRSFCLSWGAGKQPSLFFCHLLPPALFMYQLHTAPHQVKSAPCSLPARHPILNEGLLFLRSSHFSLRGHPTACLWSPCIPSYPLLFAAHFLQVARGVLRKLIWILSPTCLKSLHGCLFRCE